MCFAPFAEGQNFTFSLSSSGRVCEQIIASLGGLQLDQADCQRRNPETSRQTGAWGSRDRQKSPRMTQTRSGECVERPRPTQQFRKYSCGRMTTTAGGCRKSFEYVDSSQRVEIGNEDFVVPNARRKTRYSLEALSSVLKCPHCMQEFSLVVDSPPRDDWAYRVLGPFAVEGFALGSYCVRTALQYLAEEVATASTWVPSFTMSRADVNCEAK